MPELDDARVDALARALHDVLDAAQDWRRATTTGRRAAFVVAADRLADAVDRYDALERELRGGH